MAEFQSEYVRNTAIVSTVLTDRNGGKVRITDFAPRFRQFGRVFRPPQLFRIVEPIAGLPRITIRMRPTCDYGKPLPHRSLGSNHIRYSNDSTVIRLTTDAPLSLIDGEAPFVLTRPLHLVFGPDEPFSGDLQKTCRDFAERTHDYWMEWVRRLSISYDWQEAIIRAAITLKLSNFDETGGIIAAHTTSIPEAPSSGPHLGLSLLLAARRLFRRAGAQPHRRDAHHGRVHLVHALDRVEARPGAAPALQRRADDQHRGAHRARPCRLSRRRPGAHRQCRGRSGPERHLWQRHSRRHADVLRPPPAAAGRRRTVSSARIARRPRRQEGVRARRRHLGISRPPAHPHPFGGDVLGRLSAARGDRRRGSGSTSAPNIGIRSPSRSTPR